MSGRTTDVGIAMNKNRGQRLCELALQGAGELKAEREIAMENRRSEADPCAEGMDISSCLENQFVDMPSITEEEQAITNRISEKEESPLPQDVNFDEIQALSSILSDNDLNENIINQPASWSLPFHDMSPVIFTELTNIMPERLTATDLNDCASEKDVNTYGDNSCRKDSENSESQNRPSVIIPETSISSIENSENSCEDRDPGVIINNVLLKEDENSRSDKTENNAENVKNNKQKKNVRKRTRNPDAWKRIVEKKKRLAGEEYVSQTGAIKKAKSVKVVDCNCHYKCNNVINLMQRQEILKQFLTLGNERSKWAFIANCVEKKPSKRIRPPINGVVSKRQNTFVYSLKFGDNSVQVCKKFFLHTLDISAKKVRTALDKKQESGVVGEDKRGFNPAPNKISEERKDVVRRHIKSIPVVSSHYCRKTTKREYLPSGLSEKRLYTDYLEYCKDKKIANTVSFHFYKHIFTTEFNYGFHRPKKDQCDFCTKYKNKTEEDKVKTKGEYDLHILRKIEARQHKEVDKLRTQNEKTFSAFTMDMEKILLTPHVLVGQLYYKRKLKTYNFTVYNLKNKIATNYMWHEAHGTKGASEVATCLFRVLNEEDESGAEEVTFYSDTASGQNRNSILAAMFLRFLETSKNIKILNQKYMESGHSEMECDSVHSAIETRGSQIDVFVPEGWCTVARTAKTTPPPYIVKEMDFSDFLDFKSFSNKYILNKKVTLVGEQMMWLKVKWLQYRKSHLTSIFFKYQLSNEYFQELEIREGRTIRCSTRSQKIREENLDVLTRLYENKLAIEKKKLKDLKDLCKNGSIPSVYHDFYTKYLEEDPREERAEDSNEENE